ncbi:lipoprotein-releasing system permease protein [Pseudoalteromonas carrageenovora]|uniref:Lipoprotein-releasing system permease protein n=1 Tax=Pseudoalteromonas carrageenovora IAM 12662 TaxID=1314868 RepID=A0A2K4X8W6_PSEVC|nr:lipoprotein-releasing ABC transporter permease subunit [Pseudoalteromonas carrageenovora]MBE0383089.1 lipoprotein-releasing system permease protein [Pseudoalteromonas carrageenovora IAM 12662]QBJ71662.1 lipoprotein-releasing system permease protein [Pseudoalteromonas carrageenovora]GEB70193.1 transporter [Pseudoalteromonas carrageenovora]SOU40754.1 outer membrane-specific lipoprotein transporter subunit; membrane component of ABC superfamily [Pseudoalteromonas carrageenovora IAM 12662]
MLLSAFLSERFRAYSGHKDEKNGFVSFIAKASTVGILLGVAVLIVALSVINGFEQQLVHRLLSVVPQVEYVAPSRPIANWPEKVERLEQQPHVTGAAPFIAVNGMAQFKSQLKAVEIRGVEPSLEGNVSAVNQFAGGTLVSQLGQEDVILGKQIAVLLDAHIGDNVTLLIPQISQKGQSLLAPKRVTLTLAGIIEMGGPIDSTAAFIHLNKAQSVLGYDSSQVTGLRLRVDDVFSAHQIALKVGQSISDYVYVSSWFRTQGSLYQDIQMVRTIVYIVVFLIIAVASFNIVSSLVMEVREKQGNIAILKTMGAKDSTILATFVMQGLTQALVGVLLGTLVGVVLALNISELFTWVSQLFGANPLEGVYFIEFLPSKLVLSDIGITVIVTFVLAIFATIYPAWQATRVDPAKVLGN